jgi:hypothetical protein
VPWWIVWFSHMTIVLGDHSSNPRQLTSLDLLLSGMSFKAWTLSVEKLAISSQVWFEVLREYIVHVSESPVGPTSTEADSFSKPPRLKTNPRFNISHAFQFFKNFALWCQIQYYMLAYRCESFQKRFGSPWTWLFIIILFYFERLE